MKVTTSDFKQSLFGKVLAEARKGIAVTLTTRNMEDLVLVRKSDLDKLTGAHKQIDIEE